MSRSTLAHCATVIALAVFAWFVPDLRRTLIFDITY